MSTSPPEPDLVRSSSAPNQPETDNPPLPPNRVLASAWKHHPFQKPATAPWDKPIPRGVTMLTKLLHGFCPETMEDRWFVYADYDETDADENANDALLVRIHIYRSWTGFKIVEQKIRVPRALLLLLSSAEDDEHDAGSTTAEEGAGEEGEGAKITEITWETDRERWRGGGEPDAKETATSVCKHMLGVELEPEP
ncbi:hypothetical protein V8F20_008091 [Naviculisporaceae sp. PSN 640]